MKGTILGTRYEVIEKIGEGGMSEVYKAKCHLLNRFVAIKILKKEFARDKEFVEKFKREAASSAALNCNNIINIYDVGTQDDINYIVMELVTGKTLKEIIKENNRIEIGRAIDYSIQIAKALECAHKNNIIHRDIKPQNIMVTEDGTIKVADFGIAKATDYNTIINTTKIMGSAHYFSPEQAKGSFVDFRTDIYSLGIVMYEMLVGKVPYDADTAVSVALKHIQENPKEPMELNPAVYKGLNDIVLKAMEKDAANRYSTIHELLSDLNEIKGNPYYQIKKSNFEDDFTRVMDAVEVDDNTMIKDSTMIRDSINVKKALHDDEYEDDDDEYEDDEYEENDDKGNKKGKKKKVGFWAIIAAMVVVIGVSLAVLINMMGSGTAKNQIEVPKIEGLSKADATKKLEELGLVLEVAGEEDSTEPKDTIIRSNPKEGYKVKKGSKVKVIVSNGGEGITLKDFSKMTLEDAKKALKDQELELGQVSEASDDNIEEGKVISQNPKVGTKVKKGDKISLVVSKGKENKEVEVPDIIGLSKEDATKKLSDAKLVLEVESEEESDKPQGTVIKCNPTVGTKAKQDSRIRVVLSKGRQFITLDDFSRYSQSAAADKIEQLGLKCKVEEQESDKPKGTIISQNPAPGKTVKPGETVTLVVSKGQENVQIPTNIVGMDETAATNKLQSLGFNVNVLTKETTDEKSFGKVVACDKSGSVPKGSTVTIYIGVSGNQGEKPNQEENR